MGDFIMWRTGSILTALLVGGLAHSSPGQANDRSLQALKIPPSSCQVDTNEPFEADPFKTPSSIARFTPGGYDVLCPLPVNNIEMSKFRVTYRDIDGRGPAGEVAVVLSRTVISGGVPRFSTVCSWSSNTDGDDTIDYTSDVVPCRHDVRGRSFYHFDVFLDTTTDEVSFFGIDFP